MDYKNDVQLWLGDCLELMDNIPDKSVDAIICDLPYGITSADFDNIIDIGQMWKQYERIIKDKGNIVLFGSGMFSHKLALSNERLFRYNLVWKKSKCGSPMTAKYMPMKRHEDILVFGRSGAVYNPQMSEGTPYKRKFTPNKHNNLKYGIKGVEADNKGTRFPISVLDFPQKWRRQDQLHPTQKPVELIEYLIRTYTNDGDLVLDNAAGSMTTAIAAINANRRVICIEKDENYFNVGKNRIEAYITNNSEKNGNG